MSSADAGQRSSLLYPNHYVCYLVAATLDVLVTHFILKELDGREVNILANAMIERFGVWGLVGLKYSTIVLVVVICETIGRRRRRVGRWLATGAVVLSALPVGLGLLQIWIWVHEA